MNFLVIGPYKDEYSFACVRKAADEMAQPIDTWALDNGKKILFVNNRMPSLLKNFHIGGSFQDKAIYTHSFDDLYEIVTSQIGPCDEDRYYDLLDAQESAKIAPKSNKFPYGTLLAISTLWQVLYTMFFVTYKVFGTIFFLLLWPFVLTVISKRKR